MAWAAHPWLRYIRPPKPESLDYRNLPMLKNAIDRSSGGNPETRQKAVENLKA
jgi:hypothetical protein